MQPLADLSFGSSQDSFVEQLACYLHCSDIPCGDGMPMLCWVVVVMFVMLLHVPQPVALCIVPCSSVDIIISHYRRTVIFSGKLLYHCLVSDDSTKNYVNF